LPNSPSNDIQLSNQTSQSRIVENFIVIWLDGTISELNEDTQNSIKQLRRIVNLVYTFTNTSTCLDYIINNRNESLFLIISGSFGREFVPLIEDKTQIDSIYIFCKNKIKHEPWATNHRKIKGIFSNIERICNRLKSDLRQSESDLIPISIVSTTSSLHMNELDQSFMYSQLLKEILLDLPHDEISQKELVKFCRQVYSENDHELQIIDEFEEKYEQSSPIWWYTRECFTYSMLNKALRTQDVGIIIKMGFFVRDLHKQIEQVHSQSKHIHPFIVYRGQGMLNDEFEKMKKSKGCLLSFNNFLSTSRTKQISMKFARQAQKNPDLTAILFQIKINPRISTTPFASLDKISYYSATEKEILFSMHTVFRIDNMKQIKNRLWLVNLTLTSDNDEQLTQLTEHMRKATLGPTGLHRLGTLMIKMGEFNKAEDIFTTLLNTTSDSDRKQLASLQNQLGYINDEKGDLTNALFHYKQSLDIKLSYLPSDNYELSNIYSNIGAVLKRQGNFNDALEYLQRALHIDLHAPEPDQLKIALRYNNIGGILDDQEKYIEALKSYQYALEIRLKYLPSRHPSLATSYNNIAGVYYRIGDKSTALFYYEKSLEIDQRSLPSNHPSLSITHYNIARVLENLYRYKEAIEHAKRAVNIVCHTLDSNHPQKQIYQNYLDQLQQKSF